MSAARRIVSEWTDYDDEMARLAQQIAKDKATSGGTHGAPAKNAQSTSEEVGPADGKPVKDEF